VPRVLVSAGCLIAILTPIVLGGARWLGVPARLHGAAIYSQRTELLAQIERAPTADHLVAFLGDSTLLSHPDTVPYPYDLPEFLPGHTVAVISRGGMDPFGYYFILEPLLARHPRAVVLVANLRVLAASDAPDFSLLVDQLPPAELGHLLGLPLHARHLTLIGLALRRLAVVEPNRSALQMFVGARQLYEQHSPWRRFDPPQPSPAVTAAHYVTRVRGATADNDRPLGHRSPTVQMLAATIRRIHAAGAQGFVVVAPMPADVLRPLGLYDEARVRRRVAMLDRTVRSAGGTLLDAHAVLGAEEFKDDSGHPTDQGHRHLARVILPQIVAQLAAEARPHAVQ
jgi:hypothetical protein